MEHDLSPSLASQDYAVLRQSGTQAARVRVQLRLSAPDAQRLEKLFQARNARGEGDRQLPRFAMHDRHVAAVLAQGGFWAFSERRLGKTTVVVCLPMIPPAR